MWRCAISGWPWRPWRCGDWRTISRDEGGRTMNQRTRSLSHVSLVAGVTVSLLTVGLGAFDHEKDGPAEQNERRLIQQGRQTFRYDTFGDEAFWGDTLKLHQAIEGAALGG